MLEFATDGLTVVYGDNGSGKTGYSVCLSTSAGVAKIEDIQF